MGKVSQERYDDAIECLRETAIDLTKERDANAPLRKEIAALKAKLAEAEKERDTYDQACVDVQQKMYAARADAREYRKRAEAAERRYQDLRRVIDGGSESMTHEDAVREVGCLTERAEAAETALRGWIKENSPGGWINALREDVPKLRKRVAAAGDAHARDLAEIANELGCPADNEKILETAYWSHWCRRVEEFHRKFGVPVAERPELLPRERADLRFSWLVEECHELADGAEAGSLPEIADALADIIYITIGTALEYGIPLRWVFSEVHESNMRKEADPNGGKIRKPAGWQGPKIAEILARHPEPEQPRQRSEEVGTISDKPCPPVVLGNPRTETRADPLTVSRGPVCFCGGDDDDGHTAMPNCGGGA